jgi:hypothetical protein
MEGRSDHSMEKKNLLSLLGVESWVFGSPTRCLVTVPAEVSGFIRCAHARTRAHTHTE